MKIFRWAFGITFLAGVSPLAAQNPNCFNDLIAYSNAPVCAGQDLVFWTKPSPNGNVTFAWTGPSPNNRTSSSQIWTISNPQPSDSGTYSVTVSNQSCGQVTAILNVTINVGPVPPAPSITGAASTCKDSGFTLNATPGFISYQWSLNSSPIGGATSSSYVVAAATSSNAGNYTVSGTDANGCTSVASVPFNVTVPLCAPTVSQVTPPCASQTGGRAIKISGGSFQLNATVTIGGIAAVVASVIAGVPGTILATTGVGINTSAAIVDVVVTNPDTQFGRLVGGMTLGVRGDANNNGALTPSDASFLNDYFAGAGPSPEFPCIGGDANASGSLTPSDASYLNDYFAGAGPPPGP